jgi:alpha-galactosidase
LIFNRFGEVNNFNPLIEGSHHSQGAKGEVGCERVCDLDAKNSIHEKIVAARGNESFDVDIIKGGLPMMDKAKATFDLKAINGSQTNVTFTMNFTSKPAFMAPLMKGMMAKMLKKMLVGLKYHLETDQLVTKSNINSIMKGYRKLDNNESFVVKGLAYA